ncbi:MAG: hypothetical protein ACRDQ2_06260, partial [Gaiellales bacterium]
MASISTPSLRGNDGSMIIYPFWGTFKEIFTLSSPALMRLRRSALSAVHLYALALVLAVIALVGALVQFSVTVEAPIWVLGALSAVAILAERQSVKISANTEMSVSVFPILFAAVLYGPLEAMVVGAAALA